jgi:hypothetical protein
MYAANAAASSALRSRYVNGDGDLVRGVASIEIISLHPWRESVEVAKCSEEGGLAGTPTEAIVDELTGVCSMGPRR